MCLRIYLNGDGTGRGSHLSLFFVVMRGHSDALLKWPFNQKVILNYNVMYMFVCLGVTLCLKTQNTQNKYTILLILGH